MKLVAIFILSEVSRHAFVIMIPLTVRIEKTLTPGICIVSKWFRALEVSRRSFWENVNRFSHWHNKRCTSVQGHYVLPFLVDGNMHVGVELSNLALALALGKVLVFKDACMSVHKLSQMHTHTQDKYLFTCSSEIWTLRSNGTFD